MATPAEVTTNLQTLFDVNEVKVRGKKGALNGVPFLLEDSNTLKDSDPKVARMRDYQDPDDHTHARIYSCARVPDLTRRG